MPENRLHLTPEETFDLHLAYLQRGERIKALEKGWTPIAPIIALRNEAGEVVGTMPFHLHATTQDEEEAFVVTLTPDGANLIIQDVVHGTEARARLGGKRLCEKQANKE